MRLITRFVSKIVPFSVKRFVKKYDQKMTMQYLNEKGQLFKNHPYALEAIDVTFQQSNRPSGNMQEGKNFFLRQARTLWIQSRGCCSSEWLRYCSQCAISRVHI